MMRFVVVATMLRGALEKPEPLDDANQWRADVSRDARVTFELGENVVWAKSVARVSSSARERRLA